MKATLTAELLQQISAMILEEAAFFFVEAVESPPSFEGEVLEATVTFSGSTRGQLRLAASPLVGQYLAANLLGTEPDDPEVQAKASDALGEMLNIIGGSVLSALFESQDGPRLGLPQVRHLPAEEYQAQRAQYGINVSFCSEEGFRLDTDGLIEG